MWSCMLLPRHIYSLWLVWEKKDRAGLHLSLGGGMLEMWPDSGAKPALQQQVGSQAKVNLEKLAFTPHN